MQGIIFMLQSPWLLTHQEHPANRLFCFPYAGGGSAAIYRTWQQGLPPEVEVCPIMLPGREARFTERPYTRVEELVAELSKHIRPYLDVPFQFFGHSMGALISFDLARHLRRQQLPQPTQLFVSAHRSPQLPRRQEPMHTKTDAEFMASLEEIGGTPEAILHNKELMEIFLPLLRADFTLCEIYQYQPEAPLDYPITAFGGRDDKDIPVSDIEGWLSQTSNTFSSQTFPGGHFYLHPCQKQLLQSISAFYR
jgi:medium-chain acyl-[acyl-carrier-protein] hydrolase